MATRKTTRMFRATKLQVVAIHYTPSRNSDKICSIVEIKSLEQFLSETVSDIAHLTKKLQNDSSFSQQIGLELQSAEHASACQLEKWRKVEKCSLHTYRCSHLASEAGPSTSFALDGKRKHENENGGDAGNDLTQSKEGHPASSTSLLFASRRSCRSAFDNPLAACHS